MNLLLERLIKNDKFIELNDLLKKYDGMIKIPSINSSAKSYLAGALYENNKGNLIFLLSNELEAKKKQEELSNLLGDEKVFLFPAKDLFFYSSDARSRDVMKERMTVLNKLASLKKDEKIIVVMSSECLLDKISLKNNIDDFSISMKMSSSFDVKKFENDLMYIGYEKVSEISDYGEYSIRGGIIDIFPIGFENPIRIELWGDDVDSIRFFDVESQRAIEDVKDKNEEFIIRPCKDILFGEEKIDKAKENIVRDRAKDMNHSNIYDTLFDNIELGDIIYSPEKYINFMFNDNELCNILDYFDKDNDIVLCDELKRIEQKCNIEEELFVEYLKEELQKGKIVSKQSKIRYEFLDIQYNLNNYKLVTFSVFDTDSFIESKHQVEFNVKTIDSALRNITVFKDEIENYIKQDYTIIILTSTRSELNNLKVELLNSNLSVKEIDVNNYTDKQKFDFEERIVYLSEGSFESGFVFENLNLVVFAADEIIKSKKKAVKKKTKGKAIESFADLKVGDYIVHDDHGIGIYEGVENISVLDVSRDYLKISYADGAKLFVSIENLNLVQKYIGNTDKPPKINKLNGTEWYKAKQKARESVKEIADKLVKIYALRSSVKGHEFNQDNDWQRQFEDEFPFIETNDQLIAIEDVKTDMESSKVMDRLLCGDVGFGKTEVAIRAAFKAVQDGMQVAVLAPTTILVEQHFKTFQERMKNYPVKIDYISRFKTDKQVREALEGIRKGTIDILIGTHKLLSTNVEFKNLGLVVIDEEQRFGVEQKEELKARTTGVDTLSMSATPIPRTLHMSLSGIRDISILNEPPKERKPVQTYVIEKNNGLIKNAIYKEVGRGGQVFYLYNKVKGIAKLTNELRQLMPDIHFEYAHGTMRKSEMEEVMREFVNGNVDVLVSTTIIETGIDIPNVNTMIIEDADKMGLSQLYQLKGRVGRKSRSAFCYFTYQQGKVLTEVADKRLEALKEFTELGSGLKVAMRDLEIRGAGNLLGSEQHGHLASIGYDMYCKLLEDAINESRGIEVEKRYEMKIELNINAFIDEDYISDSVMKVDLYKRIACIENDEELNEMINELKDRFGKVPQYTENLLYIALFKSLAKQINVSEVKENDNVVTITFCDTKNIKSEYVESLLEIAKQNNSKMRLSFGQDTKLIYEKDRHEKNNERIVLDNLILLMKNILKIEGAKFETENTDSKIEKVSTIKKTPKKKFNY